MRPPDGAVVPVVVDTELSTSNGRNGPSGSSILWLSSGMNSGKKLLSGSSGTIPPGAKSASTDRGGGAITSGAKIRSSSQHSRSGNSLHHTPHTVTHVHMQINWRTRPIFRSIRPYEQCNPHHFRGHRSADSTQIIPAGIQRPRCGCALAGHISSDAQKRTKSPSKTAHFSALVADWSERTHVTLHLINQSLNRFSPTLWLIMTNCDRERGRLRVSPKVGHRLIDWLVARETLAATRAL